MIYSRLYYSRIDNVDLIRRKGKRKNLLISVLSSVTQKQVRKNKLKIFMEKVIKDAIESYQCPGCSFGSDIKCDKFKQYSQGIGCGEHQAGTTITMEGKIFLGMPKGFCRTGVTLGDKVYSKIIIFKKFEDYWNTKTQGYDKWNIPIWKHLDKNSNTLVRFISPRLNQTHIHVFLENCIDKINCFEVDQEMIDFMD
jgi:hypothetical protein